MSDRKEKYLENLRILVRAEIEKESSNLVYISSGWIDSIALAIEEIVRPVEESVELDPVKTSAFISTAIRALIKYGVSQGTKEVLTKCLKEVELEKIEH